MKQRIIILLAALAVLAGITAAPAAAVERSTSAAMTYTTLVSRTSVGLGIHTRCWGPTPRYQWILYPYTTYNGPNDACAPDSVFVGPGFAVQIDAQNPRTGARTVYWCDPRRAPVPSRGINCAFAYPDQGRVIYLAAMAY